MEPLNLSLKPELKNNLPVKVVQFGEGNFLRGFLDWMLKKLNDAQLFNGSVLAVQPTPSGRVMPKLKAQDFLYTTILHQLKDNVESEEIVVNNVISAGVNPYEEDGWRALKQAFTSADLQFVFSNTTEAGIAYSQEEFNLDKAGLSFPGKLTALLYERFKFYKAKSAVHSGGLSILPCELLEDNGAKLRDLVLQYATDWQLEDEFKAYVKEDCIFYNTLVDRVVSGYPKATETEYRNKLGYIDNLMVFGEDFHFMAIEGDDRIKEQLPFARLGLNVVVADDIGPYRLRKVRILNGAHTANVPAAFLAGLDTVDEMMSSKLTGPFVHDVLYDEIIPAVNLDKGMLTEFADAVVKRFSDPSMHHQLSAILMNCSSKMKSRVLPTILDARSKGVLPLRLCLSLAAYIRLYKDVKPGDTSVTVSRANDKSGEFKDDVNAIEALAKAWSFYAKSEATAQLTVKSVLSNVSLWGQDLSSDIDLSAMTAKLLHAICSDGIATTIQAVEGRH